MRDIGAKRRGSLFDETIGQRLGHSIVCHGGVRGVLVGGPHLRAESQQIQDDGVGRVFVVVDGIVLHVVSQRGQSRCVDVQL